MSLSAEEKIRLLEKRIIRLEEMVGRGAHAQYLFCPSLNAWLPAQCDDEGRMVIDPTDLDTRYHKKGEDIAGEDYEIDLYRWLRFHYADLTVVAYNADTIAVMNRAGTQFKSFLSYDIMTGGGGFRTLNVANPLLFKQHNSGGGIETVATGVADATANLQIDQAGHIYPVGNKVKNLGSVTNYFNNAYIEDIQCDRINPLVIATSLIPSVTETMNIGSAAKKWEDVWLNLPIADPVSAGQLWNDGGTVKVSAG